MNCASPEGDWIMLHVAPRPIALAALALLLVAGPAPAQNSEPWGGRYSGSNGGPRVGYAPRDYYNSRVNPELNTGYYPRDYYQSSMRWKPAPDTITVPYYSGFETFSTTPPFRSYSTVYSSPTYYYSAPTYYQTYSPPGYEQSYYSTFGSPNYSQYYYSTYGNSAGPSMSATPRYSYALPPQTSTYSYRMPPR
jgi:hypothetical protein